MISNTFTAPHDFNLQIQRAQNYQGKQMRAVLGELEQQVHSLLLQTAQKHFYNIRPNDVAYFMTYVQSLSRDMLNLAENKRQRAAGEFGDAYSLIFKLQQSDAHFARRIRSIIHDKIKVYIQEL
jgi:hypothetical protein